jgi:hypothetical protein
MGASPDTRSPLPTAPPDTLLTLMQHMAWCSLENTGAARWSSDSHVDVTERVGGGSEVDGRAEPEDGAAEAAPAAASELDGSGEVEEGAAEGAETLPCFSM